MNKALTYDQYAKQGNQRAFLEKYSVLVRRIAHHLLGRLPPSVLVDDLIQAGMIGLLEAQKNYDSTKGASFDTYAGIRIRGAMLDDIRRGDWVPRSISAFLMMLFRRQMTRKIVLHLRESQMNLFVHL